MSTAAIGVLNNEVERTKELFASLTSGTPSLCDGWRVENVAQRMAAVVQRIAAPDAIKASTSSESAGEFDVDLVAGERDQLVAHRFDHLGLAHVRLATL